MNDVDTSKPFSLLSTVFLFAGFIALGTLLCFLQMQYRVHDEVNARLNRAVVEMDFIFSRAEVTAASVSPLVGRDCTDMLLTKLRSIVAGTPFIRSISFVRHDEIYCTTVLGGSYIRTYIAIFVTETYFCFREIQSRPGGHSLFTVNREIPRAIRWWALMPFLSILS